jgi:hypothetical protein
MSDRADPPTTSGPVGDAAARDSAPMVEARADVDGCGCLDCRNVEAAAVHRTALDALVWSGRLFRSRPSLVAVAGAAVLARRFLEAGGVGVLPTPAVGALEAVTAFASVFLLRAYVGTVAAGELTGDPVTVREGLSRSVARAPALVGVVLLVVCSVLLVPSLLSLPLFALVAAVPGAPGGTIPFPVVAAVGGVLFAVPFLLLLFTFWLAPEACVIGRYGPVESLRVSWHVTTDYRRKFLLVVVIAVGSAVGLYLPTSLPATGARLAPLHPVSASVGELLSLLWAGAYAHVYVQGAL